MDVVDASRRLSRQSRGVVVVDLTCVCVEQIEAVVSLVTWAISRPIVGRRAGRTEVWKHRKSLIRVFRLKGGVQVMEEQTYASKSTRTFILIAGRTRSMDSVVRQHRILTVSH